MSVSLCGRVAPVFRFGCLLLFWMLVLEKNVSYFNIPWSSFPSTPVFSNRWSKQSKTPSWTFHAPKTLLKCLSCYGRDILRCKDNIIWRHSRIGESGGELSNVFQKTKLADRAQMPDLILDSLLNCWSTHILNQENMSKVPSHTLLPKCNKNRSIIEEEVLEEYEMRSGDGYGFDVGACDWFKSEVLIEIWGCGLVVQLAVYLLCVWTANFLFACCWLYS